MYACIIPYSLFTAHYSLFTINCLFWHDGSFNSAEWMVEELNSNLK